MQIYNNTEGHSSSIAASFSRYGVATKETCSFKEPTNRSQPISLSLSLSLSRYTTIHKDTRALLLLALVAMGWRRCTGCLKWQVSFCKRDPFCRALLQKETCNLRHPVHLAQEALSCRSLLLQGRDLQLFLQKSHYL